MMWAGVHMESYKSNKSLTLPTWCWATVCTLAPTRTKIMTGLGFFLLTNEVAWGFLEANRLFLWFLICFSTLVRIIRVSPEVLAYREWTIKKWGAKQCAKLENQGEFLLLFWPKCSFCCEVWSDEPVTDSAPADFSHWTTSVLLDVEACEQDLARMMVGEDQRDSSSPLSTDSPSPSPVFPPSPQHHSSSSSACSLSSGSDAVRPQFLFVPDNFTQEKPS